MRNISVSIFCFLTIAAFSQNTRKGYKLLEKLEYDKARSVFIELIKTNDQNPAAHFGMAMIYADTSAPFFNLIEAWTHCRIVSRTIDDLIQEDLETIGEYFTNTEQRHSSRPVKKKIEYAVGVVEANLIKYIREENNLDLTYEVIEKFPDFKYYGNVVHIRNQLEFRKYEKKNTLEDYVEFLDKFPDAAQVEKAIKYLNRLAFEKACEDNTVDAYNRFLMDYPEAIEFNMAEKKRNAAAFHSVRSQNTIQAYDDFILNYPGALEVAEARQIQRQLLFEYAQKIKTVEAYNEFIRKYPDGQQYIDIFNLKSLDLGMKYISGIDLNPDHVLWARSFDLRGAKETTGAVTRMNNNHSLLAVTAHENDSALTDTWMLLLDNDGKMIWNKTTGADFDDQVIYSCLNMKKETIMAGYTWLGIDSSAREVWLFKQNQEGKNIWSVKLGKWTIKTLAVNSQNQIIIGGSEPDDSLRNNYRIVLLNDLGRKLWQRKYTGWGEVNFLGVTPDQYFLVVGDNWICKIDNKGYIKWEYVPLNGYRYLKGLVSETGDFFCSGIINDNKLIFNRFGPDGKSKLEKTYPIPDTLSSIPVMLWIKPNKVLMLINYKNAGIGIFTLNAATGDLIGNHLINRGRINDAFLDENNNLMLLIEDQNAVLIKMSGNEF